jgi:UDP-N-acetylglucosamine--N-acetylmuramyl-(pentapeptide) pyrophosphoryl-undecaprenol N-acetylglucosamine transferase
VPSHQSPSPQPFHLVLTGGGTAGHVWPHFAIAADAQMPVGKAVAAGLLKVHYLGSFAGMERELVEKNAPQWHYCPISTGKLRRYFSWQNFLDVARVLKGLLDAWRILGQINAHVVFSKGGFVAAPVVWAAWLRGIPCIIHESDATPALATKLTLPFAKRALICFPQTKSLLSHRYLSRVQELGLPMRRSLFEGSRSEALAFFQIDPGRPTLLIFGGSLGAESLNKTVAAALPKLCEQWNVIHLVGKGKSFEHENLAFYRQYEFLTDKMPLAYACADVALCRAGASSLFELAAARIPMILVPLGLAASRGDQIINAQLFEQAGWAKWCEEKEFTPERAILLVQQAHQELAKRKVALQSAPAPDAAQKIGELLLSQLPNSHRSEAT